MVHAVQARKFAETHVHLEIQMVDAGLVPFYAILVRSLPGIVQVAEKVGSSIIKLAYSGQLTAFACLFS